MVRYMPGSFLPNIMHVADPGLAAGHRESHLDISATEQLSKEHAMSERLLLTMEKALVNANSDRNADIRPINNAAIMIHNIIAGHHMTFEEQYVYPKMSDRPETGDLVYKLKGQHDELRELVGRIIDITGTRKVEKKEQLDEINIRCTTCALIMRMHMSWEETILFTEFYDVIPEEYADEIHFQMVKELQGFSEDNIVRKWLEDISTIEREAGIKGVTDFTFDRAMLIK